MRILCADGCLGIIGHDIAMTTLMDLLASAPFRHFVHFRATMFCTTVAPYPATMTQLPLKSSVSLPISLQPRMTSDKVLATLTFDTASGRPPLHFLLSNDGKTVISVGRAPKSDAQLQSVR